MSAIELAVAAAVIAVLMGLMLPKYWDAQRRVNLAADQTTAAVLQSAVALYLAIHGDVPPDRQALEAQASPQPIVFQCRGQGYVYDNRKGAVTLTITTMSACR